MYSVEDFNYNLPEELIAQNPLKERPSSKMMVLNKEKKEIQHKHFFDIVDYFKKDDVLIVNNTKVFKARLEAKRESGASVEVFLLNPTQKGNEWFCLLKKAKRVKENEVLSVNKDFKIRLVQKNVDVVKENELPQNIVELIFEGEDVYEALNKHGSIPLPPYINREAQKEDDNTYQTVYAKNIGSVAAPTAGLHFNETIIEKLKEKGVKIAHITLNVGLGTFLPVKVDKIEDHTMHYETFTITKENADIINTAAGRKIAVGTTTLRALESTKQKYGEIVDTTDSTNIFIYPPYTITTIDGLITNFHLPKSTLIMLVSALAGKDFIMDAYNTAVREKYRFFSYGDCMLIN